VVVDWISLRDPCLSPGDRFATTLARPDPLSEATLVGLLFTGPLGEALHFGCELLLTPLTVQRRVLGVEDCGAPVSLGSSAIDLCESTAGGGTLVRRPSQLTPDSSSLETRTSFSSVSPSFPSLPGLPSVLTLSVSSSQRCYLTVIATFSLRKKLR
jgi:hypothetical protein